MTLMDDLKERAEEGLKTLKETAEGIAFNVEKQAKVARKKMDISKVQRRLQKTYCEIGEYVYGELAMERPVTPAAPFLSERITAVNQMKMDIRELELEIDEIKKSQPPKHDEP